MKMLASLILAHSILPSTAYGPVDGENFLLTDDPFMGHYRGRLNCSINEAEKSYSPSIGVKWMNRIDAMYYR
jgi:hypothetical protein